VGEFLWKGRHYPGSHEPLVSRDLWEHTAAVFEAANRPRYGRHRFRYTGLLSCGSCGCAITAERKKSTYTYYRCAQSRGHCQSAYLREEKPTELLSELVGRVRVTEDQADYIAQALRASQADKERDQRRATLALQQEYQNIQQTLDRAYDDRLAGRISQGLWERRSGEWEQQLASARVKIAQLERASHEYTVVGSNILELAKNAKTLFIQQDGAEQARLLRTLLSNCTLRTELSRPHTESRSICLWRGMNRTIGWEAGIRTPITWSRATCPTVERPPSAGRGGIEERSV
jgi:site-specific DNA recombinase